jgi:hypothetical protein
MTDYQYTVSGIDRLEFELKSDLHDILRDDNISEMTLVPTSPKRFPKNSDVWKMSNHDFWRRFKKKHKKHLAK